ncbi:MAG: phosphatidylserine/phosphatidylglycerophosphate/cardiolipin synthase family protein [Xanthomonadaceae bacterium]|nr:phosphatidylserine/phosphatidylglycerophosphate/cardiolipin synthase family protein [Xanthomonadaceae bacterium]
MFKGVGVSFLAIVLSVSALTHRSYGQDQQALLLLDEKEVLDKRIKLIEQETQEITAVYYLWDGVDIGLAALAAYRAAALRGVKVRIMFDGLSVLDTGKLPEKLKEALEAIIPSASVTRAIFNSLKKNCVEAKVFNPLDFNKLNHYVTLGLFSREHEKITYFKSQNTVLLGDRNWQAINFRMNAKYAGHSYRSVEVLVKSEKAANAVAAHLNNMWDHSEKVRFAKTEGISEQEEEAVSQKMDQLLESLKTSPARVESCAEPISVRSVRFIHDIMDKKREESGMERDLIALIKRARHNITIISPYFSWTKRVEAALNDAIRYHSVRVKIYVPTLSTTDAPLSSAVFELQARRLSQYPGYDLYLHSGQDMLHGKVIKIDDHISVISSHNLDFVSEFINYESGFVIDSIPFGRQTDQFIKQVDSESKPYQKQELSWGNKLAGQIAKWFIEHW